MSPVLLATFFLALFAALSLVDGVILHLFVERLPLRPASTKEHLLHTARALLFPPILVTFVSGPTPLGFTLLAVDQIIEVWDMAIERKSRAHSGGLPSREYVVHGLLTTLRALAVACVLFVDRRVHDTALLDGLVSLLLPGAILAAAAHLVLVTSFGRAWLVRIGGPV